MSALNHLVSLSTSLLASRAVYRAQRGSHYASTSREGAAMQGATRPRCPYRRYLAAKVPNTSGPLPTLKRERLGLRPGLARAEGGFGSGAVLALVAVRSLGGFDLVTARVARCIPLTRDKRESVPTIGAAPNKVRPEIDPPTSEARRTDQRLQSPHPYDFYTVIARWVTIERQKNWGWVCTRDTTPGKSGATSCAGH